MTDRPTPEADAAARLLDAVQRLTGERAGELHTRDVAGVYTRMAELIERAADDRGRLEADHLTALKFILRIEGFLRVSPTFGNDIPARDERMRGLHAQDGIDEIFERFYKLREKLGDLPAEEASK